MKTNFLSVLLLLSVNQIMAENEASKRLIAAVSQKASAGDVRGLMAMQPELETLWENDPLAYLEAMKINTHVLIAAPDPEAKKTALNAFPKILEKTCPDGTVAATSYFRLKWKIIEDYSNLVEVRESKEYALMIATFLSEIRSRRIPNYKNRGGPHPAIMILDHAEVRKAEDLPTEALKEAYAKAVKDDKEGVEMNGLQGILSSADWSLTSTLITHARMYVAKDPANRQFYQDLANRAKLTKEEIQKLNPPQ